MNTFDQRCTYSELPRWACDHCGAHPGNAGVTAHHDPKEPPRALRLVFADVPATIGERPDLHLTRPGDGTCACGQPTRDDAYGCEDCADELARILGDVPWLAEQLDIAIAGQRAKRFGAEHGDDGLPWNAAASTALAELRNELVGVVRICIEDHVRHQSPADGWPADTLPAISGWLLWRVDGLTRHETWTETLRNLRRIEGDTLRIIDNPPRRLFLGWCTARSIVGEGPDVRIESCPGAVYATEGALQGKCRECKAPYPVKESREALERELDDRLCTAAEIAHLITYLGLQVSREQVRKRINLWDARKRITASGTDDAGQPTYRYGAVRPLLSVAFEKREA
ncbi:hypothetical protein [Nocardioides terrisoli]|uniref:hypothetical protein n=1 Tax=Nocardioides terrisoli TaxID=3388267 RepID=UPI00287BB2B1|nr:hypothetical protein [Nocardioides marmorisolisilvae]